MAYVNTKEPLDKAAAIAIQGIGAIFIEKINGCYSNVIGLPLHCLFKNLKKFGVNIFEYEKWKSYVE
jgi:septum formation protein